MLTEETIRSLVQRLKNKEITWLDIRQECERNIANWQAKTNALITRVKGGEPERTVSQLCGIPYTLKDCYSTQGLRTTCGSQILHNYQAPYDATVVAKLTKAGAVLLGKTNMDAWGHGASSENTDFKPVRNPWNLDHTAGGSSGGSAVAVTTGMCLFSLGEDTGGSIRNPAGWCNVTGLKVSYGRVSRYGSIAYASSLDTVGPLAKTAEDCAVVLECIAGEDHFDATTSPNQDTQYLDQLTRSVKGLRVGLPKEFFSQGLTAEVKHRVLQAAKVLEELGCAVVETSLPSLPYGVSTYYLLAQSETSSNLARYDNIRYGESRDRFTQETMRRIMLGTYTLSAGYYDAYYRKAQQARSVIIQDYQKVFDRCDLILAPVSPTPPPKTGALINDPIQNMLADIYTVTTNTAGIPSLALPCGFSQNGLPIGMQLQGKLFTEGLLLRVGHAYQQSTEWHKRRPELK